MTVSFIGLSATLLYFQSFIWEIELNSAALWLLGSGMLALCTGDLRAQSKYRRPASLPESQNKRFRFRYCNILIFIYMVSTALYVLEIRRLGNMIGYNDLTAIGEVKAGIDELSSKMNPVVRQMYKVVTASGYIHILIFANNVFLAGGKWYKELKHLVPFGCTVIITLASGGRVNIYKIMIGLVFIVYMILREGSLWKNLYIKKVLMTGFPLMLGFILLFSAVGIIVKDKVDNRKKVEIVKYISYYAGGSIQVFNIKVEEGRKIWAYKRFGNYTFSGIYKLLPIGRDAHSERIGNGMVLLGSSGFAGNAMTIFGGAYQDFKAIGMIIFMYITYYLFGKYYYKSILNTFSSYKRNRNLLVYTYCYVSIIALAFYDNCFWILFSPTGILTLLILLIMYRIYFKKLLIVRHQFKR
jgi:oligosaccharide repeat unit polymerase